MEFLAESSDVNYPDEISDGILREMNLQKQLLEKSTKETVAGISRRNPRRNPRMELSKKLPKRNSWGILKRKSWGYTATERIPLELLEDTLRSVNITQLTIIFRFRHS